jgi:hypothetical protein
MKPDYKSISPLPWDAEEVGVEEWFLVSREKNAAGEDDGWLRIGEIDKRADVEYAVHAANNYPALLVALKHIAQAEFGARDMAKTALREAGEL